MASEPVVRVHVGETIERAGYSIYVQELRIGGALDALGCRGLVAGCSGGDRVTLVVTPLD